MHSIRIGQPSGYESTHPVTGEGAEKHWLQARSRGEGQSSGSISTTPGKQQVSASDSVSVSRVAESARKAFLGISLTARIPQLPFYRIQGMEKWEGRVLDVQDGIFSAELEAYEGNTQLVVADFNLDLLAPETDVRPGDLIYVTARTVVEKPGFPPSRTVNVRLRRTGNWTREQVENVKERAAESKQRYDTLFE